METENPFGAAAQRADIVLFVSILSKAGRGKVRVPLALPVEGQWLVRAIAVRKQFVFGMYRRHMQTIRHLGQLDKMFQSQVTTRNWNTILQIIRTLKDDGKDSSF